MQFSGVFTALATPFKNNEVDETSLRNLVQFQLKQGVDGFVISGTTAESPVLTESEKKRIFEVVREESKGEKPLIVGTGTNNTATSIEATCRAAEWGANAALVVVPYYNKPPQAGLVAHFRAVANSTELPIVLYNVPGRTIVSLTADSIVELSKVKNIIGIKEATGDANFSKKIVELCGSDFLVSSGDDFAYLDVYAARGQGVISVLSHLIGDRMKAMAELVLKDSALARKEFRKYERLTELLFCQANPIPLKAALKHIGVFATDELRLPLVSMTGPEREELCQLIDQLGIKK